ncbi:MAG: hypothetical protein F6J87_16465 [Spirulina sp. SIO3F2]|nr:hypothetical protein [Spirulina sp. SIO3F2]
MTPQNPLQSSLSQIPPQAIERVNSTADMLMLLLMLSGPNHGAVVTSNESGGGLQPNA